jgi:hypothetical protein
MKKSSFLFLFAVLFSAAVATAPSAVSAEVNVNITVPLPGLVFPGPPPLIVIPGSYVYYPPEATVEIFFYHGYWYRPHGGHWYRSADYNGPWGGIAIGRVPRPLLHVPPHYRSLHHDRERLGYGTVKKNWRQWERERHWDRQAGNRGHGREDGRRGREHEPGNRRR